MRDNRTRTPTGYRCRRVPSGGMRTRLLIPAAVVVGLIASSAAVAQADGHHYAYGHRKHVQCVHVYRPPLSYWKCVRVHGTPHQAPTPLGTMSGYTGP